ncbi:hypothetical protein [Caballeronia zhejiangensis]|uniref:hypothetical protein n=1 Tax=Caballeronia zhejiangensis TaxID=871203 RepID=UPI00158E5B32|nr:hypothetical protein [Caballeronia zhejiangensis]
MTAEQFAYWLQGFSELTAGAAPTPAQWQSIRDHLATVFHKVTPPVGPITTGPALPMPPEWTKYFPDNRTVVTC